MGAQDFASSEHPFCFKRISLLSIMSKAVCEVGPNGKPCGGGEETSACTGTIHFEMWATCAKSHMKSRACRPESTVSTCMKRLISAMGATVLVHISILSRKRMELQKMRKGTLGILATLSQMQMVWPKVKSWIGSSNLKVNVM